MNYRLSLLKKLAKKSLHRKNKHVTLLLKGGALFAVGINKGNRHSEIDALRRVKDARGMVAVNFMLSSKSGRVGNSYPCPPCHAALKSAGIAKIFYSHPEKGFMGEFFSMDIL